MPVALVVIVLWAIWATWIGFFGKEFRFGHVRNHNRAPRWLGRLVFSFLGMYILARVFWFYFLKVGHR